MKKLLAIILFALFTGISISAQTASYPWSIGFYGVKTEYLGDLRNYSSRYTTGNLFNYTKNTIYNFDMLYGGGALSLNRYLNRYFDAGIYVSYGTIGFENKDENNLSYRNFKVNSLINTNLNLQIKFLGNEEYIFVPYITIAAGTLFYSDISTQVNASTGDDYFPSKQNESATENYITIKQNHKPNNVIAGIGSIGLGLEYKMTKRWSLRYQIECGLTTKDNIDFYETGTNNDWQLQHSLGIVYCFGKKKTDTPKFVKPTNIKEPTKASDKKPFVKEQPKNEEKTLAKEITKKEKTVIAPTPVIEKKKEIVRKQFCKIYFAIGKASLQTKSYTDLDNSVALLKENPDYLIEIIGHADNTGSERFNQKLSIDRAIATENYFEMMGISRARIKTTGIGSKEPIADNKTEDGRSQNRRVEIFILQEE